MRIARMILALPFLALSLALAGNKEADPFVKEGTCDGHDLCPMGPKVDCPACGQPTRQDSESICHPCAAKRGVCPGCLKRPPGKKEARCGCGMRTMDYRSGGSCGTCRAEIDLRDKLCGKCARAAGVCAWCGLKKEPPKLEAPLCKGCPRPEIGPAGYRSPCPSCKKPTMARFQKTCDACADAKGICSICGKRRKQ